MFDINLHESVNKLSSIVDDNIITFFQEVELAVKMQEGEVYGVSKYLNLNKYVFSRAISTIQILNEVQSYIIAECPSAAYVNWSIDVKWLTELDTIITDARGIYINVSVQTDNDTYIQNYLIGS
jgi:hypothetical protein